MSWDPSSYGGFSLPIERIALNQYPAKVFWILSHTILSLTLTFFTPYIKILLWVHFLPFLFVYWLFVFAPLIWFLCVFTCRTLRVFIGLMTIHDHDLEPLLIGCVTKWDDSETSSRSGKELCPNNASTYSIAILCWIKATYLQFLHWMWEWRRFDLISRSNIILLACAECVNVTWFFVLIWTFCTFVKSLW
jgi:hypothetical protein